MAALTELRRLLPPPPGGGDRIAWGRGRGGTRRRPASGLKAFVATYGAGAIDDFLWVYHPTTPNRYLRLGERAEQNLRALRVLRLRAAEASRRHAWCLIDASGWVPDATPPLASGCHYAFGGFSWLRVSALRNVLPLAGSARWPAGFGRRCIA